MNLFKDILRGVVIGIANADPGSQWRHNDGFHGHL